VPTKDAQASASKANPIHPASIWNQIRHHSFSILEKTEDIEKALKPVSSHAISTKLRRTFSAGLRAELKFYSENRKALQLEPLLDAGARADFVGIRNGQPVNIDVTTNLAYKDIERYSSPSRKRNRLYEIALVDLKNDRVESFPLRFPFCPECDKFSHYILFLDAPEGSQFWASQGQEIVQYCPYCEFVKSKGSYTYIVPSPLAGLKDMMDYQNSEFEDKTFNTESYLKGECAPITRFFQKEGDVLLSGVAEMSYIITDPSDADGYDSGRLLWNHPLVRSLPIIIDPPY
jgi:hypothetical protein